MVKLYEITEGQAEAMSAAMATKVLAEQRKREHRGYGEAWDRGLAGYALEWDEDGEHPLKDKNGNYITRHPDQSDVPESPTLWRYWEKHLSDKEMMNLGVGAALSLRPEVKKILKNKVEGPLKAFKENASEKTKSVWKRASETVKMAILGKWLKAKGHPPIEAGRRTRRNRGRRTTRKH
jgi:hypothetical protein